MVEFCLSKIPANVFLYLYNDIENAIECDIFYLSCSGSTVFLLNVKLVVITVPVKSFVFIFKKESEGVLH